MNSVFSFIASISLHIILLMLLIGFSWNKSPIPLVSISEKEMPIIEASLVFTKPQPVKKTKPEIQPEREKIEKIEKIEKVEKVEKPEEIKKPEKTIAIKSEEKTKEKIKEKTKEKLPEKPKMNKQAEEEALLLALKEDEAQEEAYRMAALTEIQKHMGVIKSVITRNWRQPLDIPTKGLSCTVVVKVLATGEVVDVRVTKGSGNLAFDRSTELAVRKSSPLPLPTSSAARAAFQEFEFGFYPEGV